MVTPRLTPNRIAAGLKRVGEGGEIDWQGATIPAAQVAETIRLATAPHRTVTFRSARIDGDLKLDMLCGRQAWCGRRERPFLDLAYADNGFPKSALSPLK